MRISIYRLNFIFLKEGDLVFDYAFIWELLYTYYISEKAGLFKYDYYTLKSIKTLELMRNCTKVYGLYTMRIFLKISSFSGKHLKDVVLKM